MKNPADLGEASHVTAGGCRVWIAKRPGNGLSQILKESLSRSGTFACFSASGDDEFGISFALVRSAVDLQVRPSSMVL